MLICFHFWMNYYDTTKTVVNVLLDIKSLSHQEEINLYPVDNTIGFPNTYPIYPVERCHLFEQLAQRFYFWRAGDRRIRISQANV